MQNELHATSIVVTHDLKSANMVADRMAFLYEGSFLLIGTPGNYMILLIKEYNNL